MNKKEVEIKVKKEFEKIKNIFYLPDQFIQKGNYRGVHLENKILTGSSLKECLFDGAILENFKFEGCDLTSTSFRGARLENSKFFGTNLMFTNFEGANLHGSLFVGAVLNKTIFLRTCLKYVRFENCVFDDITLNHCDISESNIKDFENINYINSIAK